MLLGPLHLRTDHQEIHDDEHQDDGQEAQQLVLGAIIGSGTVTQWSNGALSTMFSETGTPLLRVHTPKPIQDGTEARAALHDPPETFTWWTDLVLLDQQSRTTMQVAVALASHVNGILRIRK